jgi:hypothetical protein
MFILYHFTTCDVVAVTLCVVEGMLLPFGVTKNKKCYWIHPKKLGGAIGTNQMCGHLESWIFSPGSQILLLSSVISPSHEQTSRRRFHI